MHTAPTSDKPAPLQFDAIRRFIASADSTDAPAARTLMRASAMILPLDGGSAAQPLKTVVTAISRRSIELECPCRLDVGQHFCVRLEASPQSAAWVQCIVRQWEPTAEGHCLIAADYVLVNCSHACNCPAFIFISEGKKVNCPHAGHNGCLQSGPIGPQLKQMLAS